MARARLGDPYRKLADIFSRMTGSARARLMRDLEQRDAAAAEQVKAMMFTFDDLARIEGRGVQALLGAVDRDQLVLALKGAPQAVSDLFLGGLSRRAGKSLQEDIEALGPVRRANVEAARSAIASTARSLLDAGTIALRGDDDEYVV